jgi:molecular chaperone GrpE
VSSSENERPEEPVVITDKRKIDREAAERASQGGGGDDSAAPAVEPDQVPMVEATLLEERTADLQRVQAEYANYRKRADRDRLLAGDVATGRVLLDLLPVLDNLDRAKAHGDLTGAFKAVADQLDSAFTKLGLVPFGEVGDLFDPAIHEAVLHDESEAVDQPTCTTIMRPGYRHNDRLLRPAMVGVSDPVAAVVVSTEATDDAVDPEDH